MLRCVITCIVAAAMLALSTPLTTAAQPAAIPLNLATHANDNTASENLKNEDFKLGYRCANPDNPQAPAIHDDAVTVKGDGTPSQTPPIPIGYTCMFDANNAAAKREDRGEATINVPAPVTITDGMDPNVTFAHTYPNSTGDIHITAEVSPNDGRSFRYACSDGTEGTVHLTSASPTPLGLNVPLQTTCAIAETGTQGAKPAEATVTVESQATQLYVRGVDKQQPAATGQLAISTSIAGADVGDKNYTFDLKCGSDSFIMRVAAGKTATYSKGLTAGTVCTIVEKSESSQIPGYALKVSPSTTQEITIGTGTTSIASFHNTYTQLGRFTVTASNDSNFDFTASWINPTNNIAEFKEFALSGGESINFKDLPVGTEVNIREKPPLESNLKQWQTPEFSSTSSRAVTDHGNGTATVVVQAGSAANPTPITVVPSRNLPWWWSTTQRAAVLAGLRTHTDASDMAESHDTELFDSRTGKSTSENSVQVLAASDTVLISGGVIVVCLVLLGISLAALLRENKG